MLNPENDIKIRTCEMHTAGAPVRIIESGYPEIIGDTLLEKRRFVIDNLDHLRTCLMTEPRGHAAMYGALIVEPSLPQADLGVIFMETKVYNTMCGHAVIALARYAAEKKMVVAPDAEEVDVNIECPCGLVKAFVNVAPSSPSRGTVRFHSVPSFCLRKNQTINLPNGKNITVDISYGGNFFILADIEDLGLSFDKSSLEEFIQSSAKLMDAVKSQCYPLKHPELSEDLCFYDGVIMRGKLNPTTMEIKSITIFSNKEVDRAPCGSGCTAQLATLYAKNQVQKNQSIRFISGVSGSHFQGKVLQDTECGGNPAIIAEISGKPYFCGSAEFIREEADPLKNGFLPQYSS